MATTGRPATRVEADARIKIQLLAHRGWPLRKISRVLDVPYTVVRRIAQGDDFVPLVHRLACPRCGRATTVAPCPHCGAVAFPLEFLENPEPHAQPDREEQATRAEIAAAKAASGHRQYTVSESEAKYFSIRRATLSRA